MDTVSPKTRSRMMAAVRGRDTKPEIRVRSLIHGMGFRFRLHRRDLPGSPDIVLPRLRICVFVHGCFWHRHPGCRATTTPKTRAEFWNEKFETNVSRDARNEAKLRDMGWEPVVVWECETRDLPPLQERLEAVFRQAEGYHGPGEGRRPQARPPQADETARRVPL